MSNTHLQIGVTVIVMCLMFVAYKVGTAVSIQETIKEAQRSAVRAGAARWSANQETGKAEFNFVTCLKPEVK